MSKNLKRYNEVTKNWEPISSPDVTYIQNLSGDTVTDTNVYVTNYNYTDDGETGKTLSDTLTDISDDISRLQRNVSWLAEHGGGGGGGGGGGQVVSSYGIVLIEPIGVQNGGSVYTSGGEDRVTVTFMITGGTTGDRCKYSYRIGTNAPSDYRQVEVNKEITFVIDLTTTQSKSLSVFISATSPYDTTISPFTFRILQSSLSVVFDVEQAGSSYDNGIYNVMLNDTAAIIPLVVTNGLVGSTLAVVAKAENQPPYNHPSQKCTTERPTKLELPLWSIVDKSSISTSNFYVVTISASATLGENTATQENFQVRIRIINPSDITITLGVNGIGEAEQATTMLDGTADYNFKVYAPQNVRYVYYAAKITHNGTDELILGVYYDDTLRQSDSVQYYDNPSTQVEAVNYKKFQVPATKYNVGDVITLSVKAWDATNTRVKETSRSIIVEDASTDKFPRQYFPHTGGNTKDTLFASWNDTNTDATSHALWKSNIENYFFLDDILAQRENGKVELDINLFNANDKSGIITDTNVSHFRLQNHAYATVDFSRYANELTAMQTSRQGFTVSLAVKIDKTTDTNHTVFLWGQNNADGDGVYNGIRIDVDKVYWVLWEDMNGSTVQKVLTCNIQAGERITLDFSYEFKEGGSNAKIYVNGVMNAAASFVKMNVSPVLPNMAYFGCNVVGSTMSRYADFELYEFSIYTRVLSDLYTVVNSKNARLEGPISDPAVLADYNDWKKKNFIEKDEDDPSKPTSILYQDDGRVTETMARQIASNSSIPTMFLSFQNDSENAFTETEFYKKHTLADSSATYQAVGDYYDPEAGQPIEGVRMRVQLQGTTTLGYRVKNLEIIMDEYVTIDGIEVPVLFQPKKEWFPEKQFTLKADVVDSSHANNAVIGEWINNCTLLHDNPAMSAFTDETRPKDVDNEGNPKRHMSNGRDIDFDEDVNIRHTLEGFPILLFISFAGHDDYSFIGIYSFNLGRYSYYNMGLRFLECFSRRGSDGNRVSCPAIIRYYREKPTLGTINSESDVFSFEFGNAGNIRVADYPVWSQYTKAVVQSYGEFKYPSVGNDHSIWNKLCKLFEYTATSPIDSYNGDAVTIFDGIKPWTIDELGHYTQTGTEPIGQHADNYEYLAGSLEVWNAAVYYVIANAFGMSDSLGKNMVLRTWDGGDTWWTAFYDMDTALALVNNGAEDNPVTMAVDRIHTETDPQTQRTITGITYHDEDSKYAAYLSKLWGLLRCDGLLYRLGGEELRDRKRYYEDIWSQLRQRGGLLSTSDKFVDMMKSKVDRCGELIYNFDYRSKYILDTYEQNEEEGVFPAINFLHGTRVGFVREWLKKHFYFLDGLFDASRFSGLSTRLYEDSPYYNEAFVMTVSFNSAIRNLLLTFRVATPTFIAVTTGNDRVMTRFYIDKENVDTQIFIPNNTSDGSQLSITSASILTKIGGLTDGFQNITVSNATGIVHSIVEFITGPSNKLSNVNPFRSEPFVLAGESSLEKLDLSGTKWPIKLDSYEVNLGNFERLLWVDVSNSHVTSITLPKSSLDYLNVSYTDIKSLEVVSQNKLTGVSLNGCDAINNIKFSDCENVSAVTVDNKRNLVRFEVSNCQSVSAITITDCPNLQSIVISNNKALKSITINNTVQYGIDCDVSIIGCTGLENFTYQGSTNSRPILMDYFSASGIKNLDLYACSKFAGIKYNEEPDIEMYEDHYVLDLSKMTSLENVSLTNVSTLMYLRTNNDIGGVPVKISVSALYGTAIKRIFGYIEINSGGVFSMRPDFYLNDMGQKQTVSGNVYEYGQWNDRSENLADYFFTGEYDLNVKLNTDDLSRLMNGTGANLGDVYYLLSLCDSRVKNTSYMFRDCLNIVIECEIDWSTGTWPTEYCGFDENMFKYCTALEDANYMFYGCTNVGGVVPIKVMHDLSSSVKSFSYVFPDGMFYDCGQALFVDNNDIEIVEGFNPIFTSQHDFVPADEGYWTRFGMYASDIMNGLDNVTEIINSFNGSQFGFHSGEKGELLRGKKKIKKIVNSFNGMVMRDPWEQVHYLLCDPDNPQNYPQGLQIIDNSFNTSFDDTRGNIVYFGDSFFSAFKGSLTTIANSFKAVNRAPETADCQYGGFPYKIFEGMTKIQHIVGFFEGFCLFGNAFMDTNEEVIDGTPLDVTLPSYVNGNTRYDMFGTCTQLSDVSACFKKMKYGSYTIVGDGFKNNRITRVDELFNEDNSYGEDEYYTNENKALRKGMIPFHLFYQEDNGEELHLITNMNSVFRGTASTAVTFYSMDTTSNDIVDYLRNEDGSYVWNIYKHDGTPAFADKIAYFHSHISDVRTAHPELFDGTNPLYPDNVVPDELLDYQNEPLDADQMSYNVIGGDYGEVAKRDIFTVKNYFCPPDIFRYCENTPTIDISAIFLKASYGIVDGETTNPRVSGYYGKCPPMLFRPISNLYTMDEVFYGFKMMLPYSWKNGAKQYPPQLFSPLTSVRFMNRTFMETTLWGATDGDPMTVENVFDSFGQSLTIANGLWNNANWIGNSQISSALFNSCSRLEDVSDMFAKNGPLVIYKDLFLAASTTLITVSGFMERNQRTGGQVPDFWVSSVYPKIRNNDRAYYGINGSEGYITNYSSIPDSYKNG